MRGLRCAPAYTNDLIFSVHIFFVNLWRISHRIGDYGITGVKIKEKNAKIDEIATAGIGF